MYVLVVKVQNPLNGDTRELSRQFDPALAPAALSSKWTALAPSVLGLVSDLQANEPTVPTL